MANASYPRSTYRGNPRSKFGGSQSRGWQTGSSWENSRPAPTTTPTIATAPAPKPKAKIQITGRADLWATIQTIRDPNNNATKTTRILALPTGVLVNTCTRGPGGMCEALQFIPGVTAADFKGGAQ